MISTRQHAALDYATAATMGVLAMSRRLPPPVRAVLATAAASTTALATQTDYEGGLHPRVGMRAHLVLDALAGTALCGAGLMLRRRHDAGAALLLGLGAAELLVAARSSAHPASGPGRGSGFVGRMSGREARVGYPPLDVPKRVVEGVHVVDSVMSGVLGLVLPVRMTVLTLPGGGLLLHSPTRFSAELLQGLQAIGPIQHIVAPNSAHWTFVKDWQRACPDAVTWAAPGLRDRGQVRRSGVRLDRDLPDGAPADWNSAVDLTTVPGGLGFREVALFHRPTRTMVLTDLVLNLEPAKLLAPARPLVRLLGSAAPDGMAPAHVRAVFRSRGADARRAAFALLREEPERVVFAHGTWFERDGTARLRRSLRWLLE